MNSTFVDPNDPNILPYGKGKKLSDPRWATCPIGQAFIVNVPEEKVRKGRGRPGIPQAYAGQYRTRAIQQPWGYLVEHIRGR
tara:strand:+ start:237 stop:482 length:246 start_codon:yes stop_codon:yes gene_type:complete